MSRLRSEIRHEPVRIEPAADGCGCCVTPVDTDLTSCERVRNLFLWTRRLIRQGGRLIIIDLKHVDHADTKLIACLVALHQAARPASVRLEVLASGAVQRVVEFCRLEWLVKSTSS